MLPPPSCPGPPVGGGLRPAPLGKGSVSHRFPLLRNAPAPRRGGPMCPPGHASSRDPFTGRHTGRPLRKTGKPHRPPGPAAQSGASAAQMGGTVGDCGKKIIPNVSSNLGQSPSQPAGDSSCCGVQNSLLADRSQNFDRSHSLTSLHLPPAALGSLPLCTREPLALRGTGEGADLWSAPFLIPPARAAPAAPGQSPGIPYR